MQNKTIIVSLTLIVVILISVFFVAFLKGGIDKIGTFETVVGIILLILAIVVLFTMIVSKIHKLSLFTFIEANDFEIIILAVFLLVLSILLIFKK